MTQTWATTSTNDDPFTKIHRGLIHSLMSAEQLVRLVRPGNFLLHLDKMPDRKPVASESDLPEIEIVPSGVTLNGSPSDGNHYTQLYTIQVNTADQRSNKGSHQIKWALLNVFNRLRQNNIGLDPLVKSVRLVGISETLSEEPGRKVGWSLTATIEVRFYVLDWEVGL